MDFKGDAARTVARGNIKRLDDICFRLKKRDGDRYGEENYSYFGRKRPAENTFESTCSDPKEPKTSVSSQKSRPDPTASVRTVKKLSRREALLNCSLAYNQSQSTRAQNETYTSEQAYLRNHKLLKDIRGARVDTYNELNASPTPRFMTLQKNYWAMVKSQVPMWEQDIGISRPSTARTTPRDVGTRPKTPRGTTADMGTKSQLGIQPKKKLSKKKHETRQKSTKAKT